MSEDRTKDLPDARPFEERVLALFDRVFTELAEIRTEVRALGERQNALEEKVDRRLQETRPIWEAVMQQLKTTGERVELVAADVETIKADVETVKAAVKRVETKFEVMVQELFDHSTDIRDLRKRVTLLEDHNPA